MKDEPCTCPYCGAPCDRDYADIGVGVIYGPWGCANCGWSSDPQYDSRESIRQDGEKRVFDQYGASHHVDRLGGKAVLAEANVENRGTKQKCCPDRLKGLVVLDTWLRNPDRYFVRSGEIRKNLRNVFLRQDGAPRGAFRLMAIDHTHTIRQDRELTPQNLNIDREREAVLYGLFPEFGNHIEREDLEPFIERLRHVARTSDLDEVVHRTPKQWLPGGQVRQDLPGLLKRRATHVADHIETLLAADCKWAP